MVVVVVVVEVEVGVDECSVLPRGLWLPSLSRPVSATLVVALLLLLSRPTPNIASSPLLLPF